MLGRASRSKNYFEVDMHNCYCCDNPNCDCDFDNDICEGCSLCEDDDECEDDEVDDDNT